ncbi:MAG TPA: insulinase family protein, partial [Nitrospiria bacterium]|nr:insulinase family protein [Nitrospiria bacterium]
MKKPETWLNKIFVSIWVLLLFGMICPAASFARFDQPAFKPLEFHPPKGKITVFPNGLKVYLLEDHELPLIRINAVIKVGSLYEPEEMIGLASFTGSLMRTGGAGGKSGDEIDEILEFLSAGISTG